MKNFIVRTLSLVAFFAFAVKTNAQNLKGIWLTQNKQAKIEIYQVSNGDYFGKIVWTADKSKAAAKYMGMTIIRNMHKKEDGSYKGEVLDPQKDNTYNSIIKLKSNNLMELRGYIGISLFGKSENWTRVIS